MSVQVKCVHCGKMVDEFANKCPFCGKPVANKYAPTDIPDSPSTWKTSAAGKKRTPRILIMAIVGLIVIGAIIFFLLK